MSIFPFPLLFLFIFYFIFIAIFSFISYLIIDRLFEFGYQGDATRPIAYLYMIIATVIIVISIVILGVSKGLYA